VEFRVINDATGFTQLRSDWDRLYERVNYATPFQRWDWSQAWWETHQRSDQLMILVASNHGEALGIAPLVVVGEEIQFIGSHRNDYAMMLCLRNEKKVLEGFFDIIRNRMGEEHLRFVWKNMARDLSQAQFLLESGNRYGYLSVRERTHISRIPLDQYDDYDAYLASTSKYFRREIRRVGREGYQLQQGSLNGTSMSAVRRIFDARQRDRLFSSEIEWLLALLPRCENGAVNLYFAVKDDVPAAYLVALEDRRAYYVWQSAFAGVDSLGNFLQALLIEQAFREGKTTVDCMKGAYAFKENLLALPFGHLEATLFGHPGARLFRGTMGNTCLNTRASVSRFLLAKPAVRAIVNRRRAGS
jgi:CelD/BcsL family acetyltransferase involved in cellulose biosynthesis